MLRVVAPASERAMFSVEHGRFDLVGAAWKQVWQWSERPKTFIADYERYRAEGAIELLIGVQAA
jgi:predicted transcriptional regulator YdeE